jgi:thiol-disulfide isomerase/thioredoxin
MKKFLVAILAAATLTGCSLTEPIPVKGEVVSCESIRIKSSSDMPLECLGGGEGVAVSAIRGPAIVNVWGTWCKPCRQELPHLAHYLAQHPKGAKVIGIAVEEKNQAVVKKFVETHGITWPILYDANGVTRETFGMGVPVTWFIDSSGRVAYKKFGPFKSLEEIEMATIKYLGVK